LEFGCQVSLRGVGVAAVQFTRGIGPPQAGQSPYSGSAGCVLTLGEAAWGL
jgi:hypothetical protein